MKNIQKTILVAIAMLMVNQGCKKYEDTLINVDESFSLTTGDITTVRADGRTLVQLYLDKTIELKQGMKVTFKTNKGAILNPDVSFSQNRAQSQLRADQDTGVYFITASIKDGNDVKLEKNINFSLLPANPDSLSLEPDKLTYNFNSNKTITISTYLFRKTGLVTKGRTASFRAYQIGATPSDTLPVGRFTGLFNNYSNADGKLQTNIQFFSDTPDIDSNKVVFIKATATNDLNAKVPATLSLRYVR
jgi:hypothetical protein